MITMVSRQGKINSRKSYVSNISMKINRDNIGSTFQSKKVIYKEDKDGKKVFDRIEITDFKNTKETVKEQLYKMNSVNFQGSFKGKYSNSNAVVRKYMKSKNWKKVKITSNSSKKEIRSALKNHKIYFEGIARGKVAQAKKAGRKLTLKQARLDLTKQREEYEGVGGSW